ncbi:MAG: outer membrane protein assembly factor BamE [Hahellaceae bacterium]|nr:outer membrane protein assembly factor BamE [Hahellaceae bacterium]MCP5168744.1 outer membrane protein assembly factor BamE [Hahellaceae bacterium]
MQNFFRIILICTLCLSGCSFPGVYKINVQQGNIVTQDMLEKLKPGLTRRQVHFVLGTPLIRNTFSSQSDSYIYTFEKGGEKIEQQSITVYYDNDVMTRVVNSALLSDTPAY